MCEPLVDMTFVHNVTIFIVLLTLHNASASLKYEKILHKKLLDGYIKDVLPEAGHGEPVNLDFSMVLQQVSELDVKRQILTLNTFMTLKWYDPQLTWNITEMDGIDFITMGSELIWTPDVVLYNNGQDVAFFHTEIYKTKTTIQSNGKVSWNAPVAWVIACTCDITWFPIDTQICNLTFGSWTYPVSGLRLEYHEDVMSEEHFLGGEFKVNNGEWEIDSVTSVGQDMSFKCCKEPFSTITYTITLSRMSLYYFIYIILPLLCLILLFLIIFHIAAEERTSFGVTILLSVTVYLLVISEKLPEKSDKHPMLGMCFIVEFYILCFALVMAAMTGKLNKNTDTPPEWLIGMLIKMSLMKPPKRKCGVFLFSNATDLKTTEHLQLRGNGDLHHSEDEVSMTTAEERSFEEENNKIWVDIARGLDYFEFFAFSLVGFITPFIVAKFL